MDLSSSKNPEKMYSTVLNIDNNNRIIKSSKSELFLKDHVTLKTGVMMLNYNLKCVLISKNISQYLLYFGSNKCRLGEQKIHKKSYCSKTFDW